MGNLFNNQEQVPLTTLQTRIVVPWAKPFDTEQHWFNTAPGLIIKPLVERIGRSLTAISCMS